MTRPLLTDSGWSGRCGRICPDWVTGSREEMEEWTDTQLAQKDGAPPGTAESAAAHSEGELSAAGDRAEGRSAGAREVPAQGSSEST